VRFHMDDRLDMYPPTHKMHFVPNTVQNCAIWRDREQNDDEIVTKLSVESACRFSSDLIL
jgi:hypothetical protein